MNDVELQNFCKQYKVISHSVRVAFQGAHVSYRQSCRKHTIDDQSFLEAGKIKALLRLLEEYKKENKRVLIFSQVRNPTLFTLYCPTLLTSSQVHTNARYPCRHFQPIVS